MPRTDDLSNLPPRDQLLLCSDFLSLGLSDLNDLDSLFREAADIATKTTISGEGLGVLSAFLKDCDDVTELIVDHVASIRKNACYAYRKDAERGRRDSDRALELVAAWHRTALGGK